ncbi:WD40 repeat domain-containing protein [bacterium]|nr:WD40 repeat domain-containing protein [bacterium]
MSDELLRRHERDFSWSGDPAARARWLRERLRSGLLSLEKLELAGYLGDAPSRLALGKGVQGEKDEEERPELPAVLTGLSRWGRDALLRAAIAGGRASLRWHDRFDGPHVTAVAAIEAVEAWVVSPDAERRSRVASALEVMQASGAYGMELGIAAHLCTCVTEPGTFDQRVNEAFLHYGGMHDPRDVAWLRERIEDDLVAWALEDDPVARRPERSGRHFGIEPPRPRGEHYEAPLEIVRSVSFSRDGRRLLTSGMHGTVTLWDSHEARVLRSFPELTRDAHAAFSPDGRRVLAGDFHGTIKLWETETGRELASLSHGKESVIGLAFVGEDRALSLGGHRAKLWELPGGREVRELQVTDRGIASVAVSPDAKLAVTGSAYSPGALRLWEIESGRELRAIEVGDSSVADVAFSPDGRHVLCSIGHVLELWDIQTGSRARTFEKKHEMSIHDVALTPDGRLAASAGGDCAVRLWSVATGEQVHAWDRLAALPFHLACSPDGGRFVAGGRGGGLRTFEVPARFLSR